MNIREFGKFVAVAGFFCSALLCSATATAQFVQQGAKLVGPGAEGHTDQGQSVAVSADGNTAVVGGYGDNGGTGAAWVYTRSGGVWTQQGAKLVGTGTVGNANQGVAVAVSADGNTAVVGGSADNGNAGAAWVYTRTGGVWTQQGAKLVGTGTVGNANQGQSVALSADGNTAVVGGSADNGNAGAAWVYTRSGSAWTQQGAKLVGTGALGAAFQGSSVALSADGDTTVVGGFNDNSYAGAAWVYTRSSGVWTQQGVKLVGTGAVLGTAAQGRSVAVSADGNTAVVGGSSDNGNAGAAWVYTRSGGVWAQQGAKLVGTGAVGNAYQGIAVALSADGNTAIVGGAGDNDAGATWVYTRSGGVWTQQGAKLIDAGAVGSAQGISVALSADGNTAIVGGFNDNGGTGAAWVYTRNGGVWTLQGPKLVGTGAVGNANQGQSIAVSADGNTAIVGGDGDNSNVGAAWVYTRRGGVWTPQGAKLVGTGAVGNAGQGRSIAVSADGNTAVVGGHGDNGGLGAAWVYTRSGGVWAQQGAKLVGTGTAGLQPYQGTSVAVSADGNTAVVGGNSDNWGTGAAWVYTRSGGVWTQQGAKLVGTGAAGSANQGQSVAVSADGNTAVVGGHGDNGGIGAAWVYTRSGGVWAQQGATLVGTDAVGNAGQGTSVALSADGNTAVVGGYGDNGYVGATWVYTRSGGVWTQQGVKLVGTGTVGSVFQGISVALSGDGNTAVVGGPSYNSNNAGAAWVYTRSGGVWAQQGAKLVGTGAAGNAGQGTSVALSADGNTAVVGGPFDSSFAGAAWVFAQPGIATNFTVSAPATATAGTTFSFTVTALDAFNNTATGYSGTVNFTSTDGSATLPANTTLTNGTGTLSATLKTVGNQTITATDTVTASLTGTSGTIAISAGSTTHFTISAPATATAGTTFNFTVTALDAFNNTATGYAGTVHFTSSDGAASLPASATLTSGTGTFAATLKTAGNRSLTAADTVTASITGTSGTIAVSAGITTHFTVSAPTAATAGTAFYVTVTALDAFNNVVTSYGGTVHFSNSIGTPSLAANGTKLSTAAMPPDAMLTNGVGTFAVDLQTAGSQTLTVTDTVNPSIAGSTSTIAVSAGAATHFAVAVPATAAAGTVFSFTVTALDASDNTVTGYSGTVYFTSSDGAAILPANATLTNGTGTFAATLQTAGSQTLSATDTVSASITGTSAVMSAISTVPVPSLDAAALLALSAILGLLGWAVLARRRSA